METGEYRCSLATSGQGLVACMMATIMTEQIIENCSVKISAFKTCGVVCRRVGLVHQFKSILCAFQVARNDQSGK